MLDIKVLGPGCDNCKKVEALAREAVTMVGTQATIVKVVDRAEYPKYGLLYTPGLVINGKLVCGGRVPTAAEVTTWVMDALN